VTRRPASEPESELVPESDEELLAECRVDTFCAGGKGGQHQNRTESGVRLTHGPTGIVVIAKNERSQHRNRALSLERLRKRLARRRARPPKRIPTTPSASTKQRRLEEKRRQSATKRLRKPPGPE